MPEIPDIADAVAPSDETALPDPEDLLEDEDDPESDDDGEERPAGQTEDQGLISPQALRQALETPTSPAQPTDPFASFSDAELESYSQKTGDQRFQKALEARRAAQSVGAMAEQVGSAALQDQWDILAIRQYPFLNDQQSPEFTRFKEQRAALLAGGFKGPNLNFIAAQAVAPQWNRKQAMEQDRRRRAQGGGDLRPSGKGSAGSDDSDSPSFTPGQERLKEVYGIKEPEALKVLASELKNQTRKVRQHGR